MNRGIEHGDLEDTEPEGLAELCVLPISALRYGPAGFPARKSPDQWIDDAPSRLKMAP